MCVCLRYVKYLETFSVYHSNARCVCREKEQESFRETGLVQLVDTKMYIDTFLVKTTL